MWSTAQAAATRRLSNSGSLNIPGLFWGLDDVEIECDQECEALVHASSHFMKQIPSFFCLWPLGLEFGFVVSEIHRLLVLQNARPAADI